MDKNNPKKVDQILFDLAKHFPTSEVSWRTQRVFQSYKDKKWYALALAYLSVRQVQDRLTEVMGANWQCKHIVYGSKTICHLGLKLDGEWIWRSDGAGDTAYEADKGAISDSLKRAGVSWGIGRHLYNIKSANSSGQIWGKCETTPNGKFKRPLEDPWSKVRSDFS